MSMTLQEAAETVINVARQAEAIQTLAAAVVQKGQLEADISALESRAKAARDDLRAAQTEAGQARSAAEEHRRQAAAAAFQIASDAQAETEKLVKDASAEASGIVTRAQEQAGKILADARMAATHEEARRDAAQVECQNAEAALAALKEQTAAEEAKLASIRAAIAKAAEV